MVDTWKLTHIDVGFAASCCAYIVTKIRVQCKILNGTELSVDFLSLPLFLHE